MLYNNLSEILGKKKMKISTLSKKTGISRTTLTKLYYNRGCRINFSTVEKICNQLDVTVDELFEFKD